MKTLRAVLMTALALGASAWMANAEETNSPPLQGKRPPPPPPPIIAALDANSDRVIDATEMANAPTALKTLDNNGDGQLTLDEVRPSFGRDGRGGPRGEGAPPPLPEGENGTEHRPPPRPIDPAIGVLDVNRDGVIDASEIANATAALKVLDKNGDGRLTKEEMRPHRPGGRGPGGPPDDSLSF